MSGLEHSYCNHSDTILDSSSATEVCTSCGLVLNGALTYTDLHPNYTWMQQMTDPRVPCGTFMDKKSRNKIVNSISKPMGEEFLTKVGNRLNLPYSTIQHALHRSQDLSSVKSRRFHHEHLLAYALYTTCKLEKCPRSLVEISNISAITTKSLRRIEKYFSMEKNNQRTKSLSAKDLLNTFYPYLDLSFQDLKIILSMLETSSSTVQFSPSTVAAGLVYLYVSKNGIKSCTIKKISDIFQTTPMSIYRYKNDYNKSNFFKNSTDEFNHLINSM